MIDNTVRLVTFDAAGTLIFLPESAGVHYQRIASAQGISTAPPEAWESAFRDAWKSRPRPAPTADGGPSPDDHRGWWRSLVAATLAKIGPENPPRLGDPAFERFFDQLYEHFRQPGVWEPFPDAAPTLEALRQLPEPPELMVLSNFDRRLDDVLRHTGLRDFFDRIIVSSVAGAEKPHCRIFDMALKMADLEGTPTAALHAGDDPAADWQGAKQAGWHVFELLRPENSLADLIPDRKAVR